MAARTWNSGGDTDMNDGANYTGAGALLATDDLTFDNTSVVNATATGALSVASITVAATYTGTWNDGGQIITTSGAWDITPGGTFTATGTGRVTGDANFEYENSGTYSVSTQDVDLQGTGNFKIAKASVTIANLTCADAGKVTTVTGIGVLSGWNTTLTLGTGTLTLNAEFFWVTTSQLTPIVNAGATINGTSRLTLQAQHSATSTVSLAALTMTGSTTLRLAKSAGNAVVTFSLSGALSAPKVQIVNFNNNASAGVTFTTNNLAVTASTDFSWGNDAASGAVVLNMGSSTVNIGIYCLTSYNAGTGTANMGTSSWTCTAAWVTQTNHTISASAWTLTLTGNDSNFTAAGESFGAIVNNKTAGQTVSQQDALTCSSFTNTTGSWDTGGFALTSSGAYTLTLGAFTANASTISVGGNCLIANVAGLFVANTSEVILTGSANISNPHNNSKFNKLTQNGSITTTLTGSVRCGDDIVLGAGSTIQDDNAGDRELIANGGDLTVNTVTWNNQGRLFLRFGSAASNMPGDDYGTTTIRIQHNGTSSLLGTSSCGELQVRTSSPNADVEFDIGNFDITCTKIIMGNPGDTTKGGSINMSGTGNIICTGDIDAYADDGVQVNGIIVGAAGTNQITVGGDWTFGSGAAFDSQNSKVVFNGSGAQTITSNGTTFYNLDISSDARTVSIADALDIDGLFDPAGGCTIEWATGVTHNIAAWDLNGSAGNIITFVSDTPATQYDQVLGTAHTGCYVDVTDSDLSGATTTLCLDDSVDGGNNSAFWLFTTDVASSFFFFFDSDTELNGR